jgi:NhaP-type Na+/H+ or K+/H+ antiporter
MNTTDDSTEEKKEKRRLRTVAFWCAIIAVIGATLVFSFAIWLITHRFAPWQDVLEKHFSAIIGLPGAAALAFALVVFLRQTDGPLEFEAPGFKVKGAAGQVLMWAICFLAIAGAIKWLW